MEISEYVWWPAAIAVVGFIGAISWRGLREWSQGRQNLMTAIVAMLMIAAALVAVLTRPAHAARAAPRRTATAGPLVLGYTIPMQSTLADSCASGTDAAHCDSMRIMAWRRMPGAPFDSAAWRAAQLAGWLEPYVLRRKFIGGLSGHDTAHCPLVPVGTTVAVQFHNTRGWSRCYSNLVRGATP